jgi:hypothetical protein
MLPLSLSQVLEEVQGLFLWAFQHRAVAGLLTAPHAEQEALSAGSGDPRRALLGVNGANSCAESSPHPFAPSRPRFFGGRIEGLPGRKATVGGIRRPTLNRSSSILSPVFYFLPSLLSPYFFPHCPHNPHCLVNIRL